MKDMVYTFSHVLLCIGHTFSFPVLASPQHPLNPDVFSLLSHSKVRKCPCWLSQPLCPGSLHSKKLSWKATAESCLLVPLLLYPASLTSFSLKTLLPGSVSSPETSDHLRIHSCWLAGLWQGPRVTVPSGHCYYNSLVASISMSLGHHPGLHPPYDPASSRSAFICRR